MSLQRESILLLLAQSRQAELRREAERDRLIAQAARASDQSSGLLSRLLVFWSRRVAAGRARDAVLAQQDEH